MCALAEMKKDDLNRELKLAKELFKQMHKEWEWINSCYQDLEAKAEVYGIGTTHDRLNGPPQWQSNAGELVDQ